MPRKTGRESIVVMVCLSKPLWLSLWLSLLLSLTLRLPVSAFAAGNRDGKLGGGTPYRRAERVCYNVVEVKRALQERLNKLDYHGRSQAYQIDRPPPEPAEPNREKHAIRQKHYDVSDKLLVPENGEVPAEQREKAFVVCVIPRQKSKRRKFFKGNFSEYQTRKLGKPHKNHKRHKIPHKQAPRDFRQPRGARLTRAF